jgi:hypothetical protein
LTAVHLLARWHAVEQKLSNGVGHGATSVPTGAAQLRVLRRLVAGARRVGGDMQGDLNGAKFLQRGFNNEVHREKSWVGQEA